MSDDTILVINIFRKISFINIFQNSFHCPVTCSISSLWIPRMLPINRNTSGRWFFGVWKWPVKRFLIRTLEMEEEIRSVPRQKTNIWLYLNNQLLNYKKLNNKIIVKEILRKSCQTQLGYFKKPKCIPVKNHLFSSVQ